MKPILLLPPAVAAGVVIAWFAHDRRAVSELEKQNTILVQRLAGFSNGSRSVGTDIEISQQTQKETNWKQFSSQLQHMRANRGGGMRDITRIQLRIETMNRDEIMSALDEIDSLDLPEESRKTLVTLLLISLCKKDPAFALQHHKDQLGDSRGAAALSDWANIDPAAASAWLDQQITAGNLEGKSLDRRDRPRLTFEGRLIGALLSDDPTAAANRLQALPKNQRREVLERYVEHAMKDDARPAYVSLVRQQLDETAQIHILSSMAASEARVEGFAKADEFLTSIKATSAERTATVEEVADLNTRSFLRDDKLSREDVDTLRAWATTQAPDVVGKITGISLSNATQGGDALEFSEAVSLAIHYHKISGNDDVITVFLDHEIEDDQKDEARALAEKITDPTRRAAALEKLK